MNKLFLIKLVLKNLAARKMRTVLTIMGVAISIGFITFLVSFGLGLQRVSTSQITNLDALQILDVTAGKSNIVKITDEEIEKFKNLGNVEVVSPSFQVASKMEYKSSSIDGIVYGKGEESISLEDIKIINGKNSLQENSLLITSSALKQLGFDNFENALDKEILLTLVPKKEVLSEDEQEKDNIKKEMSLKITGIINNDNSAFAYINIEKMNNFGFEIYDAAKIKTNSKEKISDIKAKVESMGFKATSLKDTVDQINQFFNVFQIILIGLGAVAVVVSSLGMFNTLTINLLEKTREVGFMKILGTKNKDVYKIFLGESLFIGFAGGVIGILSAMFIGYGVNVAIFNLAKVSGNKAVELFYMPWWFILFAVAATSLVSLGTGWWPSRRASRINPLDAIRYE